MNTTGVEAYIREQEAELARRERQLPFAEAEYRDRLTRLRERMAADRIDVLLLTAPDAMCWLHGYTNRWYRQHSSTRFPPVHCTVVRADDDRTVLIEPAYHEQLVRLTSCVDEFIGVEGTAGEPTVTDFVHVLTAELSGPRTPSASGRPYGRIGVESWSSVPNPAVAQVVASALTARGATVVDASAAVRGVRRIKSPAEIAVIERAQAACDAGVRHLYANARPGMTELEAWNQLMTGVIAAGGEPTAMHETVAAGPPMPVLHGLSSRRPIGPGELFHPDAAAAVDRYHARLTRPFSMGEPPKALTRLTEIAAGAYDVVLSTARVGLPFRELHRALRVYFAESGAADGWAGGYELGVSFMPDWVGEFCWDIEDGEIEDVIEAGLVTNFESCAFVAVVDTVVFEETGPRFLSSVPRETLVVGDAR
ncbi:Xaa-Pro peptidase family protein [Streptomyces sp. NBC_00878]|uniref:M24 family metallopeptidase n=1 Tax=Streptomyces sp. NBC_00878 TaxID=2975854 RepID=UPI002254306E|nr:Xaa-Pro peptidase family protein [Streptomyces sp. NBC_00878]MCX4911679.1 Xaa-Pro peptidase family protein [Streptomyces sp. NBC_00878]